MRISAIHNYTSLRRNNIKNNKTAANPAFSGHSANPMIKDEKGYISCYILGQDMRPYFNNIGNYVKITDSKEDRARFLAQNVQEYTREFDKNRTFEKTDNKLDTTFYVADPNETVTDDIKSAHGYIIYDNEPKFPSLEQLKEKYTSQKQCPHDYFADLRDFITYQQRVISTDEDSLVNPVEENTLQQEELYKKRIEEANKKAAFAQNLFNIMYKTGEDFMYKDQLVKRLEDLKEKYAKVDSTLEDIAVEKYLVDESRRNTFFQLCHNSSHLGSVQRQAMQCYVNNADAKGIELQKKYDYYANIKAHGPEMIEQTQNELNRVMGKMARNFEEVKSYYEDNI